MATVGLEPTLGVSQAPFEGHVYQFHHVIRLSSLANRAAYHIDSPRTVFL